MTWTSLRSGMASNGVRVSAQTAPAMPKRVRMRTRKGLRALASITRSMIRGRVGVSECRSVGDSEGVGESGNRRIGDSAIIVSSRSDEPLLGLLNHSYELSEHFLVSEFAERF